jgi:hypothetical protein
MGSADKAGSHKVVHVPNAAEVRLLLPVSLTVS